MDDTRQYKEMSKEAIEIQSIWIPHWGDFITDTEMDSLSVLMSVNFKKSYGVVNGFDKNDIIWLPRQDQLQGMVVIEKSEWFLTGIATYDKYGFSKEIEYYGQFDSFEKMWLCFVMEKKYNKIWNDSDWFKAERERE